MQGIEEVSEMANSAGNFAGKVAIVTGGASGIGLATAKRLTAEGSTVVITDVDEAGGKAAAEDLATEFVRLDVSDPEAWREVVGGVCERHGGVDIAFLNAGITTLPATGEEFMAPFDIGDLSDEAYRRILGVNVDGVVHGARSVIPSMTERGGGSIVATASVAGVFAFSPDPIYTMTKHAVVGFVRALAANIEPNHISINAVLPGAVDTNILAAGFAEKARDRGVAMIDPSEIAEGVVTAVADGTSGRLWLCLANRAPFQYEFAPVEGLGLRAGGGD